MTGLKSGSGDDLWGDSEDTDETAERGTSEASEPDGGSGAPSTQSTTDAGSTGVSPDSSSGADGGGTTTRPSDSGQDHPYIVRRAIQDKSIQFERDERLTFFVHGDVVDGERELISDVETTLGRDVPKFDVREAVYRAALRNPEDVLDELLKMGYAVDEE